MRPRIAAVLVVTWPVCFADMAPRRDLRPRVGNLASLGAKAATRANVSERYLFTSLPTPPFARLIVVEDYVHVAHSHYLSIA